MLWTADSALRLVLERSRIPLTCVSYLSPVSIVNLKTEAALKRMDEVDATA